MKTIQIQLTLGGPDCDWLARVTGTNARGKRRALTSLQLEFFRARKWMLPATYEVPVGHFYRMQRDGQRMCFYLHAGGQIERFTDAEFIDAVFAHFTPAPPQPKRMAYVSMDVEPSTDHIFREWSRLTGWMKSDVGSYRRMIGSRARVIVHQQEGQWIGSIYFTRGEWSDYHSQRRSSIYAAQKDAWQHLVLLYSVTARFPVCLSCLGQTSSSTNGCSGSVCPDCASA